MSTDLTFKALEHQGWDATPVSAWKELQHGRRRNSTTMNLNSEVLPRTAGVDIRRSDPGRMEESSAQLARDAD